MGKFKVGDRVAAVYACGPFYKAGDVGTVVKVYPYDYYVDFDKVPSVRVKDGSSHWYVNYAVAAHEKPASRRMEAHKEAYRAAARANDPATSKGVRKVNKYESAVLTTLSIKSLGRTGKEIAEYTGHPLNCITPRFAPLRRKGLIKDSGVKRNKQIVWVLA